MKKQFLSLSAAIFAAIVAVALPSPTPAPAGEDTGSSERYPINSAFDKATTTQTYAETPKRYTSGVRLESPDWGISEVTGVQDNSGNSLLYHDITDTQLKAAPGETVTATILYTGSGMAGFAYIDLDNDGQFTFTAPSSDNKALQPGQELAAYTRTQIAGNWYLPDGSETGGNPYGNQTLSSFKVPETPGTYKMRFCTEWAAINPLGESGIANDGGSIIDIDLVVAIKPYKRTLSDTETSTRTQDANQPRYTNALTFTSPSMGAATVELNQQTNPLIYHSLMSGTEGCFVACAGETVSIEPTWSMNAMHSFIYVDLDGNGVFDLPASVIDGAPNGELLSYSHLDGTTKNSAGVTYPHTEEGHLDHRIAPAFTIPAGTAPGIYRLRYKIDWNNSNPGGTENIGQYGGIIADIPLLIVDADAQPSVALTGTPSNGTATYESGSALTLTPDYGYTIGTMTATATAETTAVGPENPSTMTLTRTFGGPTIPPALAGCGKVTVDVTNAFIQIPVHDGYTLIWNDEFNGPSGSNPDTQSTYKITAKATSTWSKNISERPELAEMDGNGSLILTAKQFDTPYNGVTFKNGWETGAIETSPSFATKYGRIEARIKTNKNRGTFPAFWMMPKENKAYVIENGKQVMKSGWPYGGEIDIFETVGNDFQAYATVHGVWSKAPNYVGYSGSSAANVDQWNIYALEWDETSLKFYMGDKLLHTVTKTDKKLEGSWPFDKEFYIILNQSIGGNADFTAGAWPGLPVDGTVYKTEVDWVRVYQKTESLAPVVTFIDEAGNPLAEQPTDITAEPLRVSVTTNATTTITPESETLVVTPVEGTKNQFTISVPKGFMPTGDDKFAVNFTATYPAGNEEKTSVDLSIPSYTVTWPKATARSIYYVDLRDMSTNELLPPTAVESGDKNSALVVKGSKIRADYNILINKADSYRIVAYGQVGNLKTSYKKGEETVDLTTTATVTIPPVGYQIESDVELTAETEYMPMVSWEATEGVKIAVTSDKKALTSGSRVFKGAEMAVTFTPDLDLHYDLTSINGTDLDKHSITAISRNVTADTEDITFTAEAHQHGHVIIDQSKLFTINVDVDPGIIDDNHQSLYPLGTEINYTITPAEGYMLTEVNGNTLDEPSSEPVIGSITVDQFEIYLTATVETDMATAEIHPENISDDRIALEDNLQDDQKLEDQPIHFIPAGNDPETEYHTLTFHHNSSAATVTLPASLHKDSDNPDYEFVGVSENENIASGSIIRNDQGAWKLEVTRKGMVGETLIHIYWRKKNEETVNALALLDEPTEDEPIDIYDRPLTTVRVKVVTPPAATVSASHEVEEAEIELKPGDTFNLSAITPALLDDDGHVYTDTDGKIVDLPENYATKWVSDDEKIAALSVDDEGNVTVTAENRGTTTVRAVVYDTATDKIVGESEPVTIKVGGGAIIVGIEEINADMSSGRTAVYDLSGRRITRVPAPGFYIINGVKTLVR